MVELKPCPFCGGKAEILWDAEAEAWGERGFYKVRCSDCITVHYNFFFTIEDAAETWNRRAENDT